MNRPTWALITLIVVGFVASVVGQRLFDFEALSWTELAGLWLFILGIGCVISGIDGLRRKRSGDDV